MSNLNNNVNSPFINWDIYRQDHDAGYLPTILPFPMYLYLRHGRRAMLVTFDDYIVRNDGTISLFVEFVDPGYTLKTVTFSPSCLDYQQDLDSLKNPSSDTLEPTFELHNE